MSLTTTAHATRNLIKYGGVMVVMSMIIYAGAVAAIAAYQAAHPPYTPPTVRFGRLPAIIFPDKKFESKQFTKELPNDVLPTFSDQAKVYFVSRPQSVVLALESDKQMAQRFGFTSQPTETQPGVYVFSNTNLNLTLTMHVLEGNFEMKYPYENDQMLLTAGAVPNKAGAIEAAKSYLMQASKYPDDIANGEKKVSFWKINPDGLKAVDSQSEANLARVDFFRTQLDGNMQILSPEADRATVSVLVSGSTVEGKRIVEVRYRWADIDRESFSTYPIKTSSEAYAQLQAGNYWPASDNSLKNLTIRKVYLAYFEPVNLTNFLEPIYVFEGDGNFIAYVPAITDKWVGR